MIRADDGIARYLYKAHPRIVQPNEAASATDFDKALADLSEEELRESSPESAGRGDSARESTQQATELGPQKKTRGRQPIA